MTKEINFKTAGVDSLLVMMDRLIKKVGFPDVDLNRRSHGDARSLLVMHIMALVDLRDKNKIEISLNTLHARLSMPLAETIGLATDNDLSTDTKDYARHVLACLGWQDGVANDEQWKSLPEQFGYARSLLCRQIDGLVGD